MSTKKKLFEKVFEKAKRDCGCSSKNAISTYLNTIFIDDYNFSISAKTISRYYESLEKNEINEKNISIDTLNILAHYIDYENFGYFNQQFQNTIIEEKKGEKVKPNFVEYHHLNENINSENFIETKKSTKKKLFLDKIKLQKNKIIIGSGVTTALVAGNLFLNSINQNSSCMIWKENHYEAIECEETSPQMNAVPYNETVFQLKKITRIDTLNFENAIDKVWYTKKDGEIEFYTNYGLHPENGKTLKPVTKYILTKYILNKEP